MKITVQINKSTSKDAILTRNYKKSMKIKGNSSNSLEFDGNCDYKTKKIDDYQYLIGSYDNLTKILTLQPLNSVEIMPIPSKHQENSNEIRLNNSQARQSLGHTFGSKKRQSQLLSLERNKVNVEGMGDLINVVAGTLEARPVEEDQAGEPNFELIPPCNPQAETLEAVYPLESILPKDVTKELDLKKIGTMKSTFCQEKIKGVKDKTRQAQILLLNTMFRVYSISKQKNTTVDKLTTQLDVSSLVSRWLLSTFAQDRSEEQDGSKWFWTSKGRDSLGCWILCACLHFNDWTLDVTGLAIELQEPIKKMSDLAKFIGCKTESLSTIQKQSQGLPIDKKFVKATLKLPLTFPKVSRGKK